MKNKPLSAASLLILIVLLTIALGLGASPVQAQETTVNIFLPIIFQHEQNSINECQGYSQINALITLIQEHPQQNRPSLTCNPILMQVAQEKANDMAKREFFGHVNPDGFGPNFLVQQEGYLLPSFYNQSLTGNNIESIAAGYSNYEALWDGWMSSESHARHLLGLSDFFAEQVDLGVGYACLPGSPFTHYWVVITARQ